MCDHRPRTAVTVEAGDRVAGVSGSSFSRRGVLRVAGLGGVSALLGAGALTGCDLDPHSSSEPPAAPPPDPDQGIVDAARAELRHLLFWLSPTGPTATLVVAHRRQLRALEGNPPADTRRGHSWTSAQAVRKEQRAADRFTHWALTCQNGDLARLLASVAAGIQMQPLLIEASGRTSGGHS
jgi:hypothetical protein